MMNISNMVGLDKQTSFKADGRHQPEFDDSVLVTLSPESLARYLPRSSGIPIVVIVVQFLGLEDRACPMPSLSLSENTY